MTNPSGPYNIEIEKNIYFTTAKNEDGQDTGLKLDIYKPKELEGKKLKTILWIHGGEFKPGNDKEQGYIVKFAEAFTEKGYLCISSDYRIRREPFKTWNATLDDAAQDVLAALEWIRLNEKKYNMDLDHFILAGGSAGGMIAIQLISELEKYKSRMKLPELSAFIDLWGTLDKINVNKNFPPTIIVHGKQDRNVPYVNSLTFAGQLEFKGIKSELFAIEDAGHTPVVDKYEDNFPKVVKAIENFLKDL